MLFHFSFSWLPDFEAALKICFLKEYYDDAISLLMYLRTCLGYYSTLKSRTMEAKSAEFDRYNSRSKANLNTTFHNDHSKSFNDI